MRKKDEDVPKLRQVSALVYRVEPDKTIRILVVTSLDTKRPIIPKGWPMKRLKKHDTAAREAFEEAGIIGKISCKPIGKFHYWKRRKTHFSYVRVDVFPMKMQKMLDDYPEAERRLRAWLTPEDAALLIDEPQLATIVRKFGQQRVKSP